jgi:hypothetical protein
MGEFFKNEYVSHTGVSINRYYKDAALTDGPMPTLRRRMN